LFQYILKRLLQLIPVLLVISVLVFSLIHLIPGDPAEIILGFETTDPQIIAAVRHSFGLDKPLYIQYFLWLKQIARGDFGKSPQTGRPVLQSILESYSFTIELAIYAFFLMVTIAIPLGALAAVSSSKVPELIAQAVTLFGLSTPSFWSGSMFILLFSVHLHWFPVVHFSAFFANPLNNIWGFFLPAMTLAIPNTASTIRMVRASMLEVKGQDYIKTARAKGLNESNVILKHMLKNALIPIITTIGINAGYLLGGAIVVEQIFAIPGVGRLGLQAIVQRDYPTLQGVVLFIALSVVLVNLVTDLTYFFLNPKIRYR